jgi:hypothetical protein
MRCPFCWNSSTREVGKGTFECVRHLVWVIPRVGSYGRPYSEPVFEGCGQRFTLADVERAVERQRREAAVKQAQERARQAVLGCLETSSDVAEIRAALERAERMSSEARTLLPAAVGAWCRLASAGLVGLPSYDLVDVEGLKATFGSMAFTELSRRPLWGVMDEASLWLLDAEGATWRTSDDATEVSTRQQRRFEQETVRMTFVVVRGAACEVSSRVERGASASGIHGRWRRSTARHGRVVDRSTPCLRILLLLVSEFQQSGGRCPHCGARGGATLLILPGVAKCGQCHLRFHVHQTPTGADR